MELEFVQRIWLEKEKALELKKLAEAEKVVLTCHGPYYVNLNAHEAEKLNQSWGYITNATKIALAAGVRSLTFHPGFYLQDDPKAVLQKIQEQFEKIIEALAYKYEVLDLKNPQIYFSPETTGKASAFGSLEELIQLSINLNEKYHCQLVKPCVDFAHLYARSLGVFNQYEDFAGALNKLQSGLGRWVLENMHIHLSGINYGKTGELKHLGIEESDFNFRAVLQALKDYNVSGTVICESPKLEEDALVMKKIYEEM